MKIAIQFLFCLIAQFSYGQWLSLNIQTTDEITAVHFKNNTIGFVCARNKLFKTENGGEDWTLSYQGENLFQFEDIKIISDNIVIAAGLDFNTGKSIILRSEDDGEHWLQISTSTNSFLKSIFFLDENNVFCSGGSGKILHSTDGGQHWTEQVSGTISNLQSIFFIDTQIGFAVGGGPGNSTALKTIDGGNSWTTLNLNVSSNLQSVFFTDNTTGYIVGWEGGIFKTQDGGNTWNTLASVNMQGNLEVIFTNNNTGYIVGGASNISSIQKTNNGGELWSEIGPNIPHGLLSIFFSSNEIGYVVGSNGTILKTTTAGTSSSKEIKGFSNVQCYPNPVVSKLTIKAPALDIKSINLYNDSGNWIKKLEVNSQDMEIDFSALLPGNYYIILEGEKGEFIKKVIKV